VERQQRVVRLDDGVGDLGRGENGKGGEHSIGELLLDFGEEEGTKTGTGPSSERVEELESLEEVASLGLDSKNIYEERRQEAGQRERRKKGGRKRREVGPGGRRRGGGLNISECAGTKGRRDERHRLDVPMMESTSSAPSV
jgi:hypothetical protein